MVMPYCQTETGQTERKGVTLSHIEVDVMNFRLRSMTHSSISVMEKNIVYVGLTRYSMNTLQECIVLRPKAVAVGVRTLKHFQILISM